MSTESQQSRRYARHLSLPEIGEKGQSRLKNARVLVVGAGGLGCPAALYLAGAGVGAIGIVDPDRIEVSNLQRQILYRDSELGLKKAEVAAHRLRELNPDCTVDPFPVALEAGNATELIKPYDLVLDATDNFPTRYLINDACFFLGKPSVFASVTRFEGRLSIFGGENNPCYRCLYPAPPEGVVLNCAEEGILGPVPGVLGTLQALEAIKLISGMETPLRGALFLIDLRTMQSRRLSLAKDPACPLCGTHASIKRVESVSPSCVRAPEISADELSAILKGPHSVQLIDVREPAEFREGTLPGALCVPLQSILSGEASLSSDQTLVLFCRSGQRSQLAAQHLLRGGFPIVLSLSGGLLAWPGLQ